jgi:hypothetical protein
MGARTVSSIANVYPNRDPNRLARLVSKMASWQRFPIPSSPQLAASGGKLQESWRLEVSTSPPSHSPRRQAAWGLSNHLNGYSFFSLPLEFALEASRMDGNRCALRAFLDLGCHPFPEYRER